MTSRILLTALAIALIAPLIQAQTLYKWIDKNGRISYHDRPPAPDSGYRVEEKKLREYSGPNLEAAAAAAEKFPVVLYIAPKCSSCDTARAYLQKRRVPFTERNVEGDRKLQEELIQRAGGLAVPTIMVGSKVLQGYLESLLAGELDQAGYPKNEKNEDTEAEDQMSESEEKSENQN